MLRTEYFQVVEPKTSAELRARAVDAYRDKNILRFSVLGLHEVPTPVRHDIAMHVSRLDQHDNHSERFGGPDEQGRSIRVQLAINPEDAAIVSTVQMD